MWILGLTKDSAMYILFSIVIDNALFEGRYIFIELAKATIFKKKEC